jgi:hypothetical protein
VQVDGVSGNEGANGSWTISIPTDGDASYNSTHLILNGSITDGLYITGGSVWLRTIGLHLHAYKGKEVRIIAGKGAGQVRRISDNDATTLTVEVPWDVVPDETSVFSIYESSWCKEIKTNSLSARTADQEIDISCNVGDVMRFTHGDGYLVQVFTQNQNGLLESLDGDSPFREIWVNPAPPNLNNFEKATWNLAVARSIAVGNDVAPHYDVKRKGTPAQLEFKAKYPPEGGDITFQIWVMPADGTDMYSISDGYVYTIPNGSAVWHIDNDHFRPGLKLKNLDTLVVNIYTTGGVQPGKDITIVLRWPGE